MHVIPVIDLMGGEVVRGVAGRRSEYRPIESRIAASAQPTAIARAFVERFGFETVYLADLDAILGGQPDAPSWAAISAAGLHLWLDAGVGTLESAQALTARLSDCGIKPTIIGGLESLATPRDVVELREALGPANLIFSLDLKQGKPLTQIEVWHAAPPIQIVRWVVGAGIERLLVLDLADVGTGCGTATKHLCRQIRREFPAIELIAGGGVRDFDDLVALAEAGCDAALVASALHDGRLSREDVRKVENLPRQSPTPMSPS